MPRPTLTTVYSICDVLVTGQVETLTDTLTSIDFERLVLRTPKGDVPFTSAYHVPQVRGELGGHGCEPRLLGSHAW
jgi:hypothetical protein